LVVLSKYGALRVVLTGVVVGQHHGADATHGEQLEEHRVGDAAVDDVSGTDSPAHGVEAGLHLRNHARIKPRQNGVKFGGDDLGHQRALVGPVGVQTLDVGEHEQTLCTDGGGQCAGGGVGVDVVDLAVGTGGDRGDHRDATGVDKIHERSGVDVDDVAHQPDV